MANDDISSLPEESGSHRVGAPSQIPAGKAGGADMNPGPWADYAMTVPWKVARNARKIKTQAIARLKQATPNDGPWAKCVRFHDIDRVVTACGNCQWNGRAIRCDFVQLPRVPETSRGHQRNRSSQSSMEIRVLTHREQAESGLAATEQLEHYVRQMQAEVGLHDSRNAAIHNAIQADNFAELVVPARAFIPTTTADDHQAQFDHILRMINNLKEQFVTIQRT
ncbi:hypothetical protein PCH_Pc12g02840 [Penicillium rubens Wisconsin 54-1255]|uniref:Uncharacterized protein n=1 Tax=Penicillium rubens (strain ATCC 28089 / DSM 1075 / NRRL 1951 / Wisconsin 54-1255) TaxID=500485 RepID=B6H0C5_PENRW|nr:hypothetical protein PCH_Pc12g02840 [Penicillium rubens Wisconsin 54-1255]